MGVVGQRANEKQADVKEGRRKEDRYPDGQNKTSVGERKKENTEQRRLGAN